MTAPFRVFVGWDQREPIAYDVAKFSLERRASVPVAVIADQARRIAGARVSIGATRSAGFDRIHLFALPHAGACRLQGWALFCDCDFLWLGDIAGSGAYTKVPKAVYCVQHDYRPKETTKMDGAVQTAYPRKNWSSLMLFNCDHPSVRKLTPEVVNRESGAYLHRMQWAADDDIGALPVEWNWLEGWNEKPRAGHAEGGAFHPRRALVREWQNVDYGDLWRAERDAMQSAKPLLPKSFTAAPRLVSRFGSSLEFSAHSEANFRIKATLATLSF